VIHCAKCFDEGRFWFKNLFVFCGCPLGRCLMLARVKIISGQGASLDTKGAELTTGVVLKSADCVNVLPALLQFPSVAPASRRTTNSRNKNSN
jgi:hypothetical protein